MPTKVGDLFDIYRVENHSVVQWGTPILTQESGVYIVSCSDDINFLPPKAVFPNFRMEIISHWIETVPGFLLDSKPATTEAARVRLSEFWLADECILYVGKAPRRNSGLGIGNRVREYYRTIIGKGSPHSGGQWIKCLSNLNQLFVHYGEVANPGDIELRMLQSFMRNVSRSSLDQLFDPSLPLPFANIRLKRGLDKDTGMLNQRL